MDDLLGFDGREADWKPLYKIGALAALIAVLVFRRYIAAEMSAFNGFGIFDMPEAMPGSALDWFLLLQHNTFVGLALLSVFDLINYFLVGLIFLALYAALRRVHRSAMRIAIILGLVGITVYFASNQALGMLHLSRQYAAAASEAQRSIYLAAGEALLAENNLGTIHQGTGIYVSLFLVLLAGLIISLVMLQSEVFGKVTAVSGILANGIGLVYYPALVLTPSLIWIPPAFSAPFRMIWYILIAIKLLKLAKAEQ
jgi:hypothetical protein